MSASPRPLVLTRRLVVATVLVLALPAFNTVAGALAPEPDLWDVWEAHDPGSTARIDHSAWTAYLGEIVTPDAQGVNRVDYGGAAMAKRADLDAYIATLAAIPISLYNRAEQEAYWINLYNALTIQVVLDHYPVQSIQDIDISPGLFSSGPWGKELVEIEGRGVSLNDVEHRILRPIWRDPRVHYVVNCASIGCPNLLPVAATADQMDALKNAAARDYINDPRGVSIVDGEVVLSKIYEWFTEDFGNSSAGVVAHLQLYAEPALAADLQAIKVYDFAYDWGLNDLPGS
ncbi:MAG: DUF547 domain-containing protein [Alphaproteobacteria bacterium]|nr:DUF547 domain-containing protein [Alphaproteobacteria bacterium]